MLRTSTNIVEQGVNQFWRASLAWKRVPGFVEGISVGGLFEVLGPLKCHRAKELAKQAEDLAAQIVKGRARRKKQPKSVVLQLPKKVVPTVELEVEAA